MKGAIMSVSSHPEESGSGSNSEEEFLLLPSFTLPPHFVPGHLQDLEDALLGPGFPPTYNTEDSKENSSEDRDGANFVDSRHDASETRRQDAHANEDYSNGYGQLQEQRMSTACCPLHNMEADLEVSRGKAAERNGKAGKVKAKAQEVHHDCEGRCQWIDREALCSCSIFEEAVIMCAASHLESSGGEVSSDEGLLLEPVFVPGELEDLQDALLCSKLQADSQIWNKSDSDFAAWLLPEMHSSCRCLAALCLCGLNWGTPTDTFQCLEETPGSPCALRF
ncbi:uncharacterized protein [Notamacropus eugenii]|uniref:uncharacterized protein n=1 Tax=Notamacropus eugenii TaxID=9315 RepID=UPI003B6796D3